MLKEIIPFKTSLFIDEDISINDEILNYCLTLSNTVKSNEKSNAGGWQSPTYNYVNENPILAPLIKHMTNKASEAHMAYGINKRAKLAAYWININNKNDYNYTHNHWGNSISAVVYLKVPADSGNIIFERPDILSDYLSPEQINERNVGFAVIRAKENLGIFFPSHLKHYVEKNNSNDARVSIAFNFLKEE
jgi:uncharacterized protein (TIGR02466 family)